MPTSTSTLPLELGGISDDRREQLESRRRREMARQQESERSETGNFRWSPIAMIPAHLCVLIFLCFLLEKLEERIHWPWAAVLSPLWITDALFIIIKSKEVRKILQTAVHVPSEGYALFPPVGGIIDHLGVAAAKVTLAYRLEEKTELKLLVLFIPMWTCVLLASVLRCITPPGPQVMGEQANLHRVGSMFNGFFHLVARGAQPMLIVLKLDGQLEGSWASVFIPLWIFMAVIAIGGTALCCCAPTVSRGVIPEIRPLLIRGMLLCSAGTFSLASCALLFLVFLTLELDGNEDFPASTIVAPLIALYALILVFLPVLLLVTRHYVRTMRTAEQQFRQANDPNGGTGNARFQGGNNPDASGSGARACAGADAAGNGQSRSFPGRPTILFRESSTLFRRASVSFCRRLGEADGALLETDIMSLQLADWRRRRAARARQSGRGGSNAGGRAAAGRGAGASGNGGAPPRTSRSFHGLHSFLPQMTANRMGSRLGEQGFSAAVSGSGVREVRGRYAMSSDRPKKTGADKDLSPQQGVPLEAMAKISPEDERYDRGLLQGGSGTHSVTDSYDLNSFGSHGDSDYGHEVGLSIDGDDEEGSNHGIDLGLQYAHHHPTHPGLSTPSPEILLAYESTGTGTGNGAGTGTGAVSGPGSVQGRGVAAFNLHGGSGSSHGVGSGHGLSIHGLSGHGAFGGREGSSRHSIAPGGNSGMGNGMSRVLSWPGVSSSDGGLGDSSNAGEDDEEGIVELEDRDVEDMEAGMMGSPSREPAACYICVERRPDAVVMECGHGGMCFKCAQQLAGTPPAQCPVCRKPIQQVLRFERIVTMRSGGSLVGGGGSGGSTAGSAGGRAGLAGSGAGGGTGAGAMEQTCSADELVGSGGDVPVVAIAASSTSIGVGAVAGSAGTGTGTGTGAGARTSSRSTFAQRFSAPDEAGVPAVVGSRVGGGGGSSTAAVAPAVGTLGDDSRRTPSPPARREAARRGELDVEGGVESLSVDDTWLDPV